MDCSWCNGSGKISDGYEEMNCIHCSIIIPTIISTITFYGLSEDKGFFRKRNYRNCPTPKWEYATTGLTFKQAVDEIIIYWKKQFPKGAEFVESNPQPDSIQIRVFYS